MKTPMKASLKAATAAVLIGLLAIPAAIAKEKPRPAGGKPTIVLVHGAFAESASWNGVIAKLLKDGYKVVAAANPLRGVQYDAAHVSSVLSSIPGPVVLAGHSYAGTVITNAANGHSNVKALVYVDAFEPEAGETSAGLSNLYPGSSLGPALAAPVPLPDGSKDLYIDQAKFRHQFAADVPAPQAALMAATQRPIAQTALADPSGQPAWKTIPSWSIYGSADLNIPPKVLAFMADRAHSRRTVVVKGGSHVTLVSHPGAVAALIEEAAAAR